MSEPELLKVGAIVHVLSPFMGGEFTWCGDAFDGLVDEDLPDGEAARGVAVNCTKCIKILMNAAETWHAVKFDL